MKCTRLNYKAFASGIRCFFAFCELKGAKPFPIKEAHALEWGSIFNEGQTYQSYLNCLRKACFVLRYPIDWYSPAVVYAARCLRAAGKRKIRFPNFIRSELVLRIIKHEGDDSEFARLAYLAFLFAFRVPSEALILQRASKNDEIELFTPQREKGLISLRRTPQGLMLIVKLSYRKNMPGGCIMRRPCFCKLGSKNAARLCPVHWFWPWVTKRKSGQQLFPSLNGRNINRILRAILKKIHVPASERYTSHGFRRGAAQELKESGSQWPIVASLGQWNSLCFNGYVDVSDEMAQQVGKLFINSYEFESDDEISPIMAARYIGGLVQTLWAGVSLGSSVGGSGLD